jgi:hypothetical protein
MYRKHIFTRTITWPQKEIKENTLPEFKDLLGHILTDIKVDKAREYVLFTTSSGDQYKLYHPQDCSEQVCLEEVVGDLTDLLNSPILFAEESSNEGEYEASSDIYKWTFYKLSTNKGSVTLRWYGTSNGYYSVDVLFTHYRRYQ